MPLLRASSFFWNGYLALYMLLLPVVAPRLGYSGWDRGAALLFALTGCGLALARRPAAPTGTSLCLLLGALAGVSAHPSPVLRAIFAWGLVSTILASLEWRRTAPGGRGPALVLGLSLAFLGGTLALLAVELLFRLMMVPGDGTRLPFLSSGNTLWKTAELYDRETNSLGLRERELPELRPPGTYRVLFMGDSVTFGLGVPLEETFVRALEKELNGQGLPPRVETLNLGYPGQNLVTEFKELKTRGAVYEPNLVVWVFFPNDMENVAGSPPGSSFLPWLDALYKNWLSYEYLRMKWAPLQARLTGQPTYQEWLQRQYARAETAQVLEQTLFNVNVWCAHRGCRFAVVLFPFMEGFSSYPMSEAHAMVGGICERLGVSCLDLLPVFQPLQARDYQLYPNFDHHPNAKANRLVTPVIRDFLVPLIRFDSTGR